MLDLDFIDTVSKICYLHIIMSRDPLVFPGIVYKAGFRPLLKLK